MPFSALAQTQQVQQSEEDKLIDELAARNQAFAEQVDKLNALKKLQEQNPGQELALDPQQLQDQVVLPGSQEGQTAPRVVQMPGNMKWLRPMLGHPAVVQRMKRTMEVAASPQVQSDSLAIVNNPNLKQLYVGLAIVFFAYVLVRRRVLAATDRWWFRILLRLSLAPILFLGVFLVTYGVLGQPFFRMMLVVRKVMF